jgi:alcohol dehydrogenase
VAGLLTPRTVAAAHIALERDATIRWHRLTAAASDGACERLRPAHGRMRALVASPGGRLSWRAVPAPPPPRPQGALVHPIAVATCDLDRALALGATPFPLPLRFGHECVAEVLSVGDQVAHIRPGQRVVVPFQISCGSCSPCLAGHSGNCASVPPISMYGFGVAGGHWGGALSDQLAVPYADAMLVPLPAALDPVAAASVADNVCDGYRHIAPFLPDLLERDPDAKVLIVAGVTRRPMFSPSIPLYAGLVARALGARRVHLADVRPPVRYHAGRLGLLPLHPGELRRHLPAPLVVDGSAHSRGLRLALSKTAPDGVCSSAGTLHVRASLPVGLMYGRNVALHIARTHARTHIPQVLKLMSEGRLHPEAVATTVASLEDAPGVLHEHLIGDGTKTILTESTARGHG